MFSLLTQAEKYGRYSRESFQNLDGHTISCFCLYVSGVLLKSGVGLFSPLGEDFLEAFLYLGPPPFPSFILFWEPSTKAQAHQSFDSVVIEGLGEAQDNITLAAILPQEKVWPTGRHLQEKTDLGGALVVARKPLDRRPRRQEMGSHETLVGFSVK